jgi:AcrR family transcriptional regulator
LSVPARADASRAGRPRRFDFDTERQLLIDAAMAVMTREFYPEVGIAGILREAGVSTRSFYRHFDSKDALFVAVMHRDAELVGRSLSRVVGDAPNPRAAVEAWLDEYLDGFYEPKIAPRTMLYASAAVRTSPAVITAHTELQQEIVSSLVKALRAGHRSGHVHSPHPVEDAKTILALVAVGVGLSGRRRTRRAAKEHVIRFAWPALAIA